MQIGTSYSYARSMRQMSDLSTTADRLQSEIATGKRITAPSVDPVAAARLARLANVDAANTQFASNVTLARSVLSQSDSSLESIQNQLQRASELAIKASNETLNATDRAAIGVELASIVDDLLNVANSSDVRGTPLFGGAGTGPAYTRAADGTISFAGEGQAPPIPIGDKISISASDSGDRLFGNIAVGSGTSDMFAIVSNLAKALAPGGSADAASLRTALDAGLKGINAANDRVATARASVGARGARLELESERLAKVGTENEIERGYTEGVDLQSSIVELQKTLTTLQATQASFTKLSQLSLFDYIR